MIVSGSMGDHGLCVMAARAVLPLNPPIRSDCAPLAALVEVLLEAVGPEVRCLRDPTRGGLAATLNEIARDSGVEITIQEEDIPISPTVSRACELLGLSALEAANEGKVVAVVAPEAEERALAALRSHPLGEGAARIGRVGQASTAGVRIGTSFGASRMLDFPSGEMLPRIC